MNTDWDEPHDVKGLARVLKRHASYVYTMRAAGFTMPGERATLRMAFDWLAKNEGFKKARFARRVKLGENGVSAKLAGG